MRRPVDAQTQDIQRAEMLRQQQMLTQQRARPGLPALVAASRRKPVKHRHAVDDAEVRAHQQAGRDARHELRSLESIGPAQLLCEALDEAADDIIEETVGLVADDFMHAAEDVAGVVIDEVDGFVGDMADDFMHLVHLD